MSGCSLSAGGTNSWPSGRIPDIEKLDVGLPSDHGRVRALCQPDDRSDKMGRNIRRSKWSPGQGARHRGLHAHLNENSGGWRFWRNRAVAGVVGSAVNAGPILCVLTTALMGADASAGVIALDEGTFTEAHELDRKWQVPQEMIGRRLSQEEAKRLLAKFGSAYFLPNISFQSGGSLIVHL